MGDKEIDEVIEELPYSEWTCPTCGNDTFKVCALGRRSLFIICTECNDYFGFGE